MAKYNNQHKMVDSVSMGANITSSKTNVQNIANASMIVSWSAGSTPVGTITVEVSNSSEDDFHAGNEVWTELDFGDAINVSGNSGTHDINFDQLTFKEIRIKYNRSSGSGTLDVFFFGKSGL